MGLRTYCVKRFGTEDQTIFQDDILYLGHIDGGHCFVKLSLEVMSAKKNMDSREYID